MLADGTIGQAMVSSGASTGVNGAIELRDAERKRFGGKSVLRAVEHVNTVGEPAREGRPRPSHMGRSALTG